MHGLDSLGMTAKAKKIHRLATFTAMQSTKLLPLKLVHRDLPDGLDNAHRNTFDLSEVNTLETS